MYSQWFEGKTWLMDPQRLSLLATQAETIKTLPSPKELASIQAAAAAGNFQSKAGGALAVICIGGPIEYRTSGLGYLLGFCSVSGIAAQLNNAMNNPGVGAILMAFDSPGGDVVGIAELGEQIYQAAKAKPIYGLIDPMACSAGYWLASACGHLGIIESGDAGSIGVYCMHTSYGRALSAEGIDVTLVGVPEYKTELNPYTPLTADGQDYLQSRVEETYRDFVEALARNNSHSTARVQASYGRGRVLSAREALAADMVDEITSLEDYLSEAIRAAGGKAASPKMQQLRAEHMQRKLALHGG